jgi:hypothetical protein
MRVAVKNPRKIEFEIKSSPSKIASRKYLPTNEKNAPAKGQEFSARVPKGELTARAANEDKNDTEISSPKIQKIDGANYKIDGANELMQQ